MPGVVDCARGLSDASGDSIVMVQGWKAVELKPEYGVSKPCNAKFGELKGVRFQSLVRPLIELD